MNKRVLRLSLLPMLDSYFVGRRETEEGSQTPMPVILDEL